MNDSILLGCILAGTLGMFIWGHYRYDTIALMCLLALVVTGLVPSANAFDGFGNPAVITVAAVMVITGAISQTGLVQQFLVFLTPFTQYPAIHIGTLCIIGAILSAFMNNVGALALLMPIAIESANKAKLSPSKILMPLSFATVLGGMTTMIGTPPNLLVSSFRQQASGNFFTLFDYTPVGLTVAVGSILFIILLGWRYIPERRKASKSHADFFQIQDYISEIVIPPKSRVVGMTRKQLENLIEGDFSILGLIRGRTKKLVIHDEEELKAKDILIIEASQEDLNALISKGKLELVHGDIISPESLGAQDINTVEAVVTAGSRLEGRSWQSARIRSRLQLNLLAIARGGRSIKNRLNHVNFNVGDILLIQGNTETMHESIINLGLVPLAHRAIQVGFKRSSLIPLLLFFVGIVITSLQWLTVSVSFTLVVVAMVMFNVIPMRRVYNSIDWSIIILLGALLPLGYALQNSGTAEIIASSILFLAGFNSPLIVITLILIATMMLSDLMNNAATTVVMAPIAISLANTMGINADALLMAVAVGASCSFLTPISHQNNTLIMGPGGYKFYDYIWLGIPVEVIVLATAIPALYFFWL